jgi:hypothetical protein
MPKAKPADAEDFDYVSERNERGFEAVTTLRARRRNWRELLDPLMSNETYEDLVNIERNAVAKAADGPRRIPISEIVVAERPEKSSWPQQARVERGETAPWVMPQAMSTREPRADDGETTQSQTSKQS